MKKMNKKGFTIVELVIVIAVIAILAAVMIPTFSGIVDRANKSAALQEVKNAYTSTLVAELETEETTDDVISKLTNEFNVKTTKGKFVTVTKDGGVKEANSDVTTAPYKVEGGKIVCDHDWATKTEDDKHTCTTCGKTVDHTEGTCTYCK